jgi:zinc transporter 9
MVRLIELCVFSGVQQLFSPSIELSQLSPEMWLVLGFSFVVDGWVLKKTFDSIRNAKPANVSFLEHFRKIRDPTTLAVFMEASADCLGVVLAIAGIGASQLTDMPIWDSVAGVSISCLLGGVGFYLARLNQQYLLGQAVESGTTRSALVVAPVCLLACCRSLRHGDSRSMHAQKSRRAFVGYCWRVLPSIACRVCSPSGLDRSRFRTRYENPPSTPASLFFPPDWLRSQYDLMLQAEVDFDGTYLAAKLLDRYQDEFLRTKELRKEDLRLLLAWYAEDVMRTVEREVRDVEAVIRAKYPEAQYIELEPDSKEVDSYAIDDSREMKLRRIEMETINQMLKMLRKSSPEQAEHPEQPAAQPGQADQDDDRDSSKR